MLRKVRGSISLVLVLVWHSDRSSLPHSLRFISGQVLFTIAGAQLKQE